jgi:hypothetical protein
LHASTNIIGVFKSKKMVWAGHVARMGEIRNAYKILRGRPRRVWEDNIRMDFREIGWEGVDWIHRVQWRALVNTIMNFRL